MFTDPCDPTLDGMPRWNVTRTVAWVMLDPRVRFSILSQRPMIRETPVDPLDHDWDHPRAPLCRRLAIHHLHTVGLTPTSPIPPLTRNASL